VPVSIGGGPPVLYEIPADKEIQEMLTEAEATFWQRVIGGNPPGPTTYADIVDRFGSSPARGALVASGMTLEVIQALKTAREKISSLEACEQELKGMIIEAIGDKGDSLISSRGDVLCTYKLAKGRETFDAKKFMNEHPEMYPLYIKAGEPSRRFLVKV
jgi:hypothetical protein